MRELKLSRKPLSAENPSSVGQIVYLEVDKVHPNSYNPNVMSQEKFEALVDFCKNHGADKLDPIWVRRDGLDKFEVIDGEHRWKAAKEVGWLKLRAFIIQLPEEDAKAFNVRKNRERGQLDPFKTGDIFLKEQKKGRTSADIGRQFGYAVTKSASGSERSPTVCDLIDIAKHKAEIIAYVQSHEGDFKRVTFHKAKTILRELKREAKIKEKVKTDVKEISEDIAQRVKSALPEYVSEKKRLDADPELRKQRNLAIIQYFVNLLETGELVCPYCGTNHATLEWVCCRKPLWEEK